MLDITELEKLGYVFSLEGAGGIRYSLASTFQPNPEAARPLLADLVSRKAEAVDFLQSRASAAPTSPVSASSAAPIAQEALDALAEDIRDWRAASSAAPVADPAPVLPVAAWEGAAVMLNDWVDFKQRHGLAVIGGGWPPGATRPTLQVVDGVLVSASEPGACPCCKTLNWQTRPDGGQYCGTCHP